MEKVAVEISKPMASWQFGKTMASWNLGFGWDEGAWQGIALGVGVNAVSYSTQKTLKKLSLEGLRLLSESSFVYSRRGLGECPSRNLPQSHKRKLVVEVQSYTDMLH